MDLLREGASLVADGDSDDDDHGGDATPWQQTDDSRLLDAVSAVRSRLSETELATLDGQMVEQAARVSKLRVERAAVVLHNLVKFRRANGWPIPLSASSVGSACLRTGMHQLLPPDNLGCPVLLYKAALLDPTAHPVASYQRLGSYLVEVMTRDAPAVQHGGITLLLDLQGVGLGLAASFKVADVRRGVGMWRNTFPAKVTRLLIVNAPGPVLGLMRVGLYMLSPKIRKRVRVFHSLKELVADVGADSLPVELGGTLSAGYWDEWCAKREVLEEGGINALLSASEEARDAQAPVLPPTSPPASPPASPPLPVSSPPRRPTARLLERLAPALVMCTALITARAAVLDEIATGRPALRGLVHAGVMSLFVAICGFSSHPIGLAFCGTSCVMLARATWYAAPAWMTCTMVVAAATALPALPGGVRPGAALMAAASALTLVPATAARLSPAGVVEVLAAAFHRSFVCALGSIMHPNAEPMVITFVGATLVLASCYAMLAKTDGWSATALAVIGAALEIPRAHANLAAAHSPPTPPLVPSPIPPLLRMDHGVPAFGACIGYSIVLLWEAMVVARPLPTLAVSLTRAVHVAAVGGFVAAIAPSAPRMLRASKVLIGTAGLADVALCVGRLRTSRVGIPPRVDVTNLTNLTPPHESLLLWLRALGALSTAASFALVRPPCAADERREAAAANEDHDVHRRDPLHWRARTAAAAVTAVFLLAHWALALTQPSLEDSIAMAFHFVLLVGSFSLWAICKGSEMALWLARLFAASEVATCAGVVLARGADAWPADEDGSSSLAVMLAALAAVLMASLASVPVTLVEDRSFLSFDDDVDGEERKALSPRGPITSLPPTMPRGTIV